MTVWMDARGRTPRRRAAEILCALAFGCGGRLQQLLYAAAIVLARGQPAALPEPEPDPATLAQPGDATVAWRRARPSGPGQSVPSWAELARKAEPATR